MVQLSRLTQQMLLTWLVKVSILLLLVCLVYQLQRKTEAYWKDMSDTNKVSRLDC